MCDRQEEKNLEPLGVATYTFTLGNKHYTQPFIICRRLTRSIILGRDFLRTNKLHVGWSKQGKFQVTDWERSVR